MTYKTQDGDEHETFIEYNAPVTKREDLRPVLEDMAKEAEEALGMVRKTTTNEMHIKKNPPH